MLAGTVLRRSVFVRELMPQDLKLELLDDAEARATARALARVVGLAHGHQMNDCTRVAWRRDLETSSARKLDAPAWLWSSVVHLIGIHECAYLEHCRRCVLALEESREQQLA